MTVYGPKILFPSPEIINLILIVSKVMKNKRIRMSLP